MDQSSLLVLAIAVIIALASLGLIRARQRREATPSGPADTPFAVSTEGMKICPKCAMGSSWAARTCSACGATLRG